jgi:neutral ceramidase
MSVAIGIAHADISPPVGIPMVGFAARGPAIAVHDPLQAAALALISGSSRVILIRTDLLDLQASTVATVRHLIGSRTGIPPEAIMVTCAHNHFGPDVDRSVGTAMVDAYRENLVHVLAGMASQALDCVQSARMGVG